MIYYIMINFEHVGAHLHPLDMLILRFKHLADKKPAKYNRGAMMMSSHYMIEDIITIIITKKNLQDITEEPVVANPGLHRR